ncbi:MAG: Uma2 family endonuclease [Bacteroidota bacterium]
MITVDVNKVYTYADYLRWNFEEQVELIRGKLFPMTPAPARRHQTISTNLTRFFVGYIKPNDPCKFFHPPFDVRLPQLGLEADDEVVNVVQPDLCIVCDPSKLDDRGCLGPPDLIVEILSPSTSHKDLNDKYDLYEEAGVKEYWVVFPGENVVQVYTLDGTDKYGAPQNFAQTQTIPVGIFQGDLVVHLDKVFVD